MVEAIITIIAVGAIALGLFVLFAIGYKPPQEPERTSLTQEELVRILDEQKRKL